VDVRWAISRLRSMSPAEVGFRVGRKVQGTAERAGIGLARIVPAPAGACGKPWVPEIPRDFDPEPYVRAANRVLDGVFDVFALRGAQLGFPPHWNIDPKTKVRSPLVFGKDLDYRDPSQVGDVKYLWELNRHLELVTLAQAYHLTGERTFAEGCRVLLESWLDQAPYPLGIHWCVSLEHAIRLVNWSIAWHLLGGTNSLLFAGEEGRQFQQRWLASVYRHCHFIARHWSRHSSANNHLLGEATGLFIATQTWPVWRESERWSSTARWELTRAALSQTFGDGVNKEQALWYHCAVADMMLLAGLVGRTNGVDLGGDYWRRLQAMLEFVASIADVGDNVPAIGDADEGVLVRWVPEKESDGDLFRSMMATGAVLFAHAGLRQKAGVFDERSRWLLGDGAEFTFESIRASIQQLPVRRAFREGGYYVLGEEFETPREVRLVADAGPLGFLSIAAHGHADALSFCLSVAGKPVFIDPGTYAYQGSNPWRRYFKGTRAHNTVVVDGEDQSVYGGSFIWLGHARVRAEKVSLDGKVQELVASHDGYRRLPDPVTHRRSWVYGDHRLIVADEIRCAGTHQVEVCWHFAPECAVALRGNVVVVERERVRVELVCPEGLTPRLIRGDGSNGAGGDSVGGEVVGRGAPGPGWYSTGFDVKVPTTTAVFAGAIHGEVVFGTEILISVA
jgi:hypothetical protein